MNIYELRNIRELETEHIVTELSKPINQKIIDKVLGLQLMHNGFVENLKTRYSEVYMYNVFDSILDKDFAMRQFKTLIVFKPSLLDDLVIYKLMVIICGSNTYKKWIDENEIMHFQKIIEIIDTHNFSLGKINIDENISDVKNKNEYYDIRVITLFNNYYMKNRTRNFIPNIKHVFNERVTFSEEFKELFEYREKVKKSVKIIENFLFKHYHRPGGIKYKKIVEILNI